MRFPLLCVCWLTGTLTWGDEPAAAPPDPENKNRELALELTTQWARKYRFDLERPVPEARAEEADSEVVLREQPILRWSNPERGEIYGNVFLWTRNGRPAAVGSLFKWYSPFQHMSHEFHSLTTTGLTASLEDAKVWNVEAAGVTYAPVPDAPQVADSLAARLTQMRQLSRQFSARATQRDGQASDLRLLTQPVYRYERKPGREGDAAGEPIDGGLFVFVEGTDPELWLLLEAHRKGAEASPVWNYAVARMNSIAVEVRHQDKIVARLDTMPWADVYGHKEAYTSFRFNQP